MLATRNADRTMRTVVLVVFAAIGLFTLGTVRSNLFVPLFLLLPFCIIAIPVGYALRETAEWQAWEFLSPLAAFLSWGAAVSLLDLSKSLSNLVELPILGVVSAVVLWLRGLSSTRVEVRARRRLAMLMALVLGAVVAVLMPSLPE